MNTVSVYSVELFKGFKGIIKWGGQTDIFQIVLQAA
jgi:hypothetical protein